VADQARSTTSGVRRHRLDLGEPTNHRFEPRLVTPAPPPLPAKPPGPFGDLSLADIDEIAGLAADAWRPMSPNGAHDRRRGTRNLLEHLAAFPGLTWQERWEASGLNERGTPVGTLADGDRRQSLSVNRGLRSLLCLRVVRPGLDAFRANHLINYAEGFRQIQRDPLLEEYFDFVAASGEQHKHRLIALFDVTAALTVFGISLVDLTPEALLYYGTESRRLHLTRDGEPGDGTFAGRYAWHFLRAMGRFPASVPATMRAAAIRGQRTITEMVDRHRIRNSDVRDLLIDYVTRRSPELDYPTIENLARELAGLFWARIERISPGQQDLRIDDHVYEQWRAEIGVRDDGSPRLNIEHVLLTVRSLYLDLQSWAVAEPETWGRWAARCPVRQAELSQSQVRRRRITDRMADRTRQRQPLLPLLAEHVDRQLDRMRGLLAATGQAPPGTEFTHDSRAYRRTDSESDRRREKTDGNRPVRVTDLAEGRTFDVAAAEEQAFWQWAVVETLRHSGIRAEELVELTHLSVRQYQRKNGEVAALLVIAPSKTDRERVIPMSAELFAVIAAIIRRHLQAGPSIPLLKRYDLHERTWSDPMPFLFQRKTGVASTVMSFQTVWRLLRRACYDLAKTRQEFIGLTFAAHDFRRIFATELVNSGLPIHIGAALLGHLSLQTTRGYVAVFNDDVVRHYQAHLERRRTLRPAAEYAPPTDAEWTEFEEHFDKRKVELGTCGRPYGTGCQHEHACLRCPVLQVDPRMLARLDEIEADLLGRRKRAEDEGWHGEIEGLDLTLSFLRAKRAHTQRFTRRVHLGLPMPRQQP
jgi:site-specific recombinase XerD